jgi:hypothetical protein
MVSGYNLDNKEIQEIISSKENAYFLMKPWKISQMKAILDKYVD